MSFRKNTLNAVSLLSMAAVAAFFYISESENSAKYTPRSERDQALKRTNHGIAGAIEYWTERRKSAKTGKIELSAQLRAQRQVEEFSSRMAMQKKSSAAGITWQEMGPDNVGGRTRAVLIDRNNGNRMYAGGVAGGLWHSDNGGISWYQIKNQNEITTNLAIASIAQSADGTVYFGTGEVFTINFFDLNVNGIGSSGGTPGIIGKGIWKSSNNGNTFTRLPSTVPSDTNKVSEGWAFVSSMGASPTNANLIYAATEGGLRVSYDAGTTWTYALYSTYPPPTPTVSPYSKTRSDDIKVASDGSVIASIGNQVYFSATGDTARFIQQAEDAGNSMAKITTTFDHGFVEGQDIQITGGIPVTPYSGTYTISSVTPNTFVINKPFTVTSTSGAVNTFTNITSRLPGLTINGRLVCAFAPSDPKYIYCMVSKGFDITNPNDPNFGKLVNLYQSKDKAKTWTIIVPGSASGLDFQGGYDMLLGVVPDNPEQIIAGGVELYTWKANRGWEPMATTTDFAIPAGLYVHADKHDVDFHPDYGKNGNKTLFISTDGGIYKSKDGGFTFEAANRRYNVTQMYAVGFSPTGQVAGGTQDNGNPYINFKGVTNKSQTYNLPSGDGGFVQFSAIMHKKGKNGVDSIGAVFWESQNGGDVRAPSFPIVGGSSFMPPEGRDPITGNGGAWVTPFLLWESFNDTNSNETVQFIADTNYAAGATITLNSSNNKYPFKYKTDTALFKDDTIKVKDIVQSKMFMGMTNGVYLSKDALDFSKPLVAIPKLPGSPGYASCMAYSMDGNVLFVGAGSTLYRFSNILSAYKATPTTLNVSGVTSLTKSFAQTITSVAVDKNNTNNVIVTLGWYDANNHVQRSTNALTTLSFTSIQGNLPKMPVYGAVIEMKDSNNIIIATEYGIYATSNGFDPVAGNVTWTEENNGFPRVPSVMIRQQWHDNSLTTGVENSGEIYVATHGRGIFKTSAYNNPPALKTAPAAEEQQTAGTAFNSELNIYPNPVGSGTASISFGLDKSSELTVKLYDLNGKVVKVIETGSRAEGMHTLTFSTNDLRAGNYFVGLSTEEFTKAKKLMVVK